MPAERAIPPAMHAVASVPMLDASRVTTGYARTVIVREVSLLIQPGEIVSIVGRNGVGKTTLMKAIIGLLPLQHGALALNGQAISTMPAHERARIGIGYVPQGRGVFPGLTVEENLHMGQLINSRSGARHPHDMAYQFFPRLQERRRQRAGTLSGGEQAMLAIGRALIGQPRLILLDEPSEGLQPNLVQQIGEDLARINAELGTTVLFVEQNIELIMNLSQRGYVMDKGQIRAELSGADIRDQATLVRYLAV